MTVEVMNEMLSVHPKAIALNAVELGLLKDDDEVSLKSLCTAILKRQKEDNLTNSETRNLTHMLFSLETAVNKVSLDLIPVSNKELKAALADSISSFALGFLVLLLFFLVFKVI